MKHLPICIIIFLSTLTGSVSAEDNTSQILSLGIQSEELPPGRLNSLNQGLNDNLQRFFKRLEVLAFDQEELAKRERDALSGKKSLKRLSWQGKLILIGNIVKNANDYLLSLKLLKKDTRTVVWEYTQKCKFNGLPASIRRAIITLDNEFSYKISVKKVDIDELVLDGGRNRGLKVGDLLIIQQLI